MSLSRHRTTVYLLIAALSLAVAVWQPRDALAEHARSATTRLLESGLSLQALASPQGGPRALVALQLPAR